MLVAYAYNPLIKLRDWEVKRTLEGMVAAGEELLRQALDANRRLRQAEADGEPPEEVERHQVLADRLYRQVTEHQLIATGKAPHIIH